MPQVRCLVWAVLALAYTTHAQPAPREARPGDLAPATRLDVRGDTLHAEIRLTNRTRQTVRVGFGDCSLRLVGRRAAPDGSVADSAVVWDTHQAGPPETRPDRACLLYLASAEIGPVETLGPDGDRGELVLALAAGDVLPDSVAGGLFRVEARFDVAALEPLSADPPDLAADAGTIRLVPPRPPVGAAVTRYGLPFRVVSWSVSSGPAGRRVAASVLALPRPYGSSDVVGFDTCAARIAAFASAADLAEASSRRPVASVPAACGQGRPVPTTTADGRTFYVEPDGPVALTPDVTLGALGLPPGTWWLGLDLRPVGGFSSPAPLNPVWLALGPVIVR